MKNLTLTDLLLKYGEPDKARGLVEKLRWPNGPVCPHCRSNEAHKLTPKEGSKSPARQGVFHCGGCRKQYTVTVGTIMEGSHIPLVKWIAAIFLMAASKKAISSHQIHRMLGITYKTAWFMTHRIRHAMGDPNVVGKLVGTVEVDETYIGGVKKGDRRKARAAKGIVVALVERKGRIKATATADNKGPTLRALVREHVDISSRLMSDENPSYGPLKGEFVGGHEVVKHSRHEYVRGEAHTQTVDSFWALLKRGIHGSFHHVSKQHLSKYVDEFAFRWNNRNISDGERMNNAFGLIEGKRLMYKDSSGDGGSNRVS